MADKLSWASTVVPTTITSYDDAVEAPAADVIDVTGVETIPVPFDESKAKPEANVPAALTTDAVAQALVVPAPAASDVNLSPVMTV